MKINKDLIRYIPCLYASFIIGIVALEIGVLLPYLMDELQLNYTLMGGLLSMFAIGNLFASSINSYIISKIGRKPSILILSSMIPLAFLLLAFSPSYYWLNVIVAMLGLGRGSISIYIYSTANDDSEGKQIYVHWLSMIFAIGAFVAPLLTNILLYFSMTWHQIILLFFGMTVLVPILFIISKCDDFRSTGYKSTNYKSTNYTSEEFEQTLLDTSENTSKPYFKCTGFYVLGLILFFYIGMENCVNGWFISYFKDMNIMTDAYAYTLVSITWSFVIIGRIASAFLSTKMQRRQMILINCIGSAVCFLMLISTKQLGMITVSIVGFGFFCAGIYPTTITSSKSVLKGSVSGMSMLLAVAAIGGIITPQLVGIFADHLGLVPAIVYLLISMIGMIVFAVVNFYKKYSEDIE
ncbi:MFS transporter [[Clostridium] fimetarium]|uniref:Fucose permease n=1 Tax=[Clostridium] fimetarium TaxID=99656 RepID=A0A1I0MVE5_9FIRM|nr:MFS transporter [[Clostridium] fimetarium]SEV92768.1 Fucose permease [[Clostridium] fimetarium]